MREYSDHMHWGTGSWCMNGTSSVTAQYVILGLVRDHAAYVSWIAR